MKKLLMFAGVLSMLVFASCDSPTLEGTWVDGQPLATEIGFHDDKYTEWLGPNLSASGTFSVSGDTLTIESSRGRLKMKEMFTFAIKGDELITTNLTSGDVLTYTRKGSEKTASAADSATAAASAQTVAVTIDGEPKEHILGEFGNSKYVKWVDEIILRGFWWALLAVIISGAALSIVRWIIFGNRSVVITLMFALPNVAFVFYIGYIRDSIGWYIFGGLVGLLFVVSIIFYIFRWIARLFIKSGKIPLVEVLQSMADDTNAGCPVMVQDGVKLHSQKAVPPSTLQNNYILTTLSKDNVDASSLKGAFTAEMRRNLKANSETRALAKMGITIKNTYYDKDGQWLLDAIAEPKDYR